MSGPAPTVFLVDDDPSVLKSLSRLVRSEKFQAAMFASPREFLDRYDPRAAGCLVLDVAMPGLDGLQLQRELKERGCALPIVFLTANGNIPISVQAMKGGAVDFLTKPVDAPDLIRAIEQALAMDRERRFAGEATRGIEARLATLTPREREVLEHVVTGQLNKQIASDLGTVEKTVKVHRARVMEKMKVSSVAELVRLAERVGIGR